MTNFAKSIISLLILALLSIGASGCVQSSNEDLIPENGDQIEEPQTPEEDEDQNEVKTDSGRYIGQADNNFIEIKISGVPDEMDPTVFMLSEDVKESFAALGLETEQIVKIEYFINENDQKVIIKIEKL